VEFDNKHFRDENKKYNKDDFFDNLDSGTTAQKRFDKPKYKKYVEKKRND
jgi:hypothetical protein